MQRVGAGEAGGVPHVGIISLGSLQWLGGVHYTSNLLRALQMTRESQLRVSLVTHADARVPLSTASETPQVIVGPRPAVHPKSLLGHLLSRTPFRQTFGWLRPRLVDTVEDRYRRAAARARAAGIDVLFPVVAPVGPQGSMRWIGWFPDFQHRELPHFFPEDERRVLDRLAGRLASEAPLLVTSSETVRQQFEEFFPASRGRVRLLRFRSVVTSADLVQDETAMLAHYELSSPFFVVANQFWRHKNHRTFIEAFHRARQRDPEVKAVLTGHLHDYRSPEYPSRVVEEIERRGLSNAIRFLGVIPREHLLTLMARAVAVVQPSLAEGWSTVVEDARAVGARLIVSNIAVHREQAPAGSRFFSPLEADELSEALLELWAKGSPSPAGRSDQLATHQPLIHQYAKDFAAIVDEVWR